MEHIAPLPSDEKSKREIVDEALSRIHDSTGQGRLTFTRVYDVAAQSTADAADQMRHQGIEQHPLAGMPISIKDLFDVKGETTLAGSRVLEGTPAAAHDAEVVRRLRRVGAAIVGKTNMTEFAFSGLGLNPHYGTPLNGWDRANARIPGGSSSGAAISIVDGMAVAAIGTDTGGSCRIPAALNGIVGMKPSASSVPTDGLLPLSESYDSIGPLTSSVTTCANVYSVISNTSGALTKRPTTSLRLGVITNYVLAGMDGTVASAYESAIKKLAASGAHMQDVSLPVLEKLPELFQDGGVVAAEAYHWHRDYLARCEDQYDPRVSARMRRGASITAADYLAMLQKRRALVCEWQEQTADFDAVLMPTVPIVAPKLDDLIDDDEYNRSNLLLLRNPTVVNALNGCAISIPCHLPGEAPVGLSIAGAHGRDWSILGLAFSVEKLLRT